MKDPRHKSDLLRFKYINKYLKGKEIIDLGADEGYLHELLIKNNPNKKIFSCDIKNSDFNRDLNKPFKINKKFDTVIAGEIIEHLENPSQFLRQCNKLLKKGGRLILTTPNAVGLQYIKNPEWCVSYEETFHIHAFTMPMLKSLLKKEKYQLVQEDYINAFWVRNPLKVIPQIIKKLRTDLLIVAEKV